MNPFNENKLLSELLGFIRDEWPVCLFALAGVAASLGALGMAFMAWP